MGSIESKPNANDIILLSTDENSEDSDAYINEKSLQNPHNLIDQCNPDKENKTNINTKGIENDKTNDYTNKGSETGKDDDNINMNDGATKLVVGFNLIEKNKEQIFITNKNPKKKFALIKRGRPQKKNISTILIKKHPSSADDNACRKIFNSCKKNSYDYITNLLPKELNIILHMPTIEKQMGYSYKNNRKFFKKKMYQIFLDSIPKRVPDYLKEKRDEYTHNKNMIDQNTIRTKNGNTYDITGFKTFGGCFNDCYNQAQKRVYKNHIIQIYESKTKDRKERRKK